MNHYKSQVCINMTWRAWWMTMIIDGSCHGHIKVFFPPSIKHCLLIEYGKDQKWSNENHVDLEQDWPFLNHTRASSPLSLSSPHLFFWLIHSVRAPLWAHMCLYTQSYLHASTTWKKPLCAWRRQRKYARGELRVESSWLTPENAVCLRFFLKKSAGWEYPCSQ